MALQLLVLPGDGIGPEIVDAGVTVLQACQQVFDLDLQLQTRSIGLDALRTEGSTLPDSVIAAARGADGIILGPVSHHDYPPPEQGGINPSGRLRIELDLYANIRPALSRTGVSSALGKPIDLVVVRENTEGFYADRNMWAGSGEFMPSEDIALAVRKISAHASRRIAERGFEIAAQRRGKLTAVHKANVMRQSDGLFLREVRKVAQAFPQIEYEELLVDATAAYLVREPERFDVLLTTNMFGDILSDLTSELSGGLGLAASLNAGDQHAAAQAQHGSAPDIAGQGIANPVSLIGSIAMLLRHLKHPQPADAIDQACASALQNPATRTVDLGGTSSTAAFGQHVADQIKSLN